MQFSNLNRVTGETTKIEIDLDVMRAYIFSSSNKYAIVNLNRFEAFQYEPDRDTISNPSPLLTGSAQTSTTPNIASTTPDQPTLFS